MAKWYFRTLHDILLAKGFQDTIPHPKDKASPVCSQESISPPAQTLSVCALSGISYQNEYYWLKLINLQQFLETGRRGLQISGRERVNTDYRVLVWPFTWSAAGKVKQPKASWQKQGSHTLKFYSSTSEKALQGSHTLKFYSSTSEKALFGQATLFGQKHLPLQHKQHYSRESIFFQSEMTPFPEKAGHARESSLFNQKTLL